MYYNTVTMWQNNNESEAVYTSHVLKDTDGKVVCPALYVYVCPICNNTGHKVSSGYGHTCTDVTYLCMCSVVSIIDNLTQIH